MTATRSAIAAKLQPLRREHRSAVAAMLRASGAFRDNEVKVALEVFDSAMVEGQDDYTMLGAFDAAGTLLGYACYGATPCTTATWDLYWIAVAPTAQNQGIGTALIAEVERRSVTEGAKLLVIETSSKSDYAATRGFYQARGYNGVARVPDFYDVGDDRIIYTKRLSPSTERA